MKTLALWEDSPEARVQQSGEPKPDDSLTAPPVLASCAVRSYV